ncbi:TPA: hypothetical protein QDB40_002045 [Burkholderia vietnamiensis]|nr:hypothetical protein [Burkholderia vietnamiensis]
MNDNDIDFNEIVEFHKKRKVRGVPGYHYYVYLKYILAMRELGWMHRLICDWLNTRDDVKEQQQKPIDNKKLSYYISLWKEHGLINVSKKDVEEIADKITAVANGAKLPRKSSSRVENKSELPKWNEQGQSSEIQKEEVDPFAVNIPVEEKKEEAPEQIEEKRLNIIEFMKAVEKKLGRTMNDSERELAKNHYNDPFNQNLIANYVLVNSFTDSIKV